MGQNSTEVAYGFGQFGSTITQLAANTVTAPEDHVIVAIQFLSATKLSALVAEDSQRYVNTAAASHTGEYTRTVNQGSGASNKIIFDSETNAAAGTQVGDFVYDSTGVLHGEVIALDPDGDNTSEIMISNSVSITDDEVLHFSSRALPVGGGGQQLANADIFPQGLTIYGRWTSMSINDDDATGGAICYFGK